MTHQELDLFSRRAINAARDAKRISLATALDALDRVTWNEGHWVPACGGSETPFTYEGQRYLYCWHTGAKVHGYIHLESDMPMPADWAPRRV